MNLYQCSGAERRIEENPSYATEDMIKPLKSKRKEKNHSRNANQRGTKNAEQEEYPAKTEI